MSETNPLFDAQKAEVKAVLDSSIFPRNSNLARFLVFVTDKYFAGLADEIKEYNIAIEALGRPEAFDPKENSIVRVEAHRLRKRLLEYYQGEGADHTVRIDFPQGNYVPHFYTITAGAPPPEAEIKPEHPSWLRPRAVRLLLGLLIVLVGSLVLLRTEAIQKLIKTRPTAPVVFSAVGDEVRIMAGNTAGNFVDRLGNTWLTDRFYRGGKADAVRPRSIRRASDRGLFLHQRNSTSFENGDISYDIPLKKSVYELRLYFAETEFGEDNYSGGGETSRVFSLLANGRNLLDAPMDLLLEVGAANTACIKVFKDIQPAEDGYLHLRFHPETSGPAFINAIEVLPGLPGKIHPIRIAAGDGNYTDSSGQVWGADRFFSGGSFIQRHEPVAGTKDELLYERERFGKFSYVIPVARHSQYTVTLKFCESYHGTAVIRP